MSHEIAHGHGSLSNVRVSVSTQGTCSIPFQRLTTRMESTKCQVSSTTFKRMFKKKWIPSLYKHLLLQTISNIQCRYPYISHLLFTQRSDEYRMDACTERTTDRMDQSDVLPSPFLSPRLGSKSTNSPRQHGQGDPSCIFTNHSTIHSEWKA